MSKDELDALRFAEEVTAAAEAVARNLYEHFKANNVTHGLATLFALLQVAVRMGMRFGTDRAWFHDVVDSIFEQLEAAEARALSKLD